MSEATPVVLVTGAGSGIGLGVAEHLAANGYQVACIGRRIDRLPKGPAYAGFAADVSVAAEIKDAVETVHRVFGRIDGLVTAAGIVRAGKFDSIPELHIEQQIATNILGSVHTIRATLPSLRVSRGAIVTFGSTLSQRPTVGSSIYAATKGAIEALTRALAIELAPDHVRINCIAPALVRSEIWLSAGMSRPAYEELAASRARTYPLGRIGEPRDIAELTAFLLSSRAGWLTGTWIPADGGSMLGSRPS